MSKNVTNSDRYTTHFEAWPIALADEVIHDDGVYYLTDDGERINLNMKPVGRSEADGVVIFHVLGCESELVVVLAHEENDEACELCGLVHGDVKIMFPWLAWDDPYTYTDESGQDVTEYRPRLKPHGWC